VKVLVDTMSRHPIEGAAQKVINDFGRQWTVYPDNSGYYGSQELFREIVEPLLPASEFKNKYVAEIGAGSGRICTMMLEAGAARVMAVEPSAAILPLRRNLSRFKERAEFANVTGDQLPPRGYDIVVSIGVLHHIPEPRSAVEAAFRGLKPGGRMLVWLYGKEGNAAYLAFLLPLRLVTKKLPHQANAVLAWVLDIALQAYMTIARVLPLPLYQYTRGYLDKLNPDKRRLVIYDQINPEHAKYYTEAEAVELLRASGFQNIRVHQRGGYSWTVLGEKPE
jgi:SAM-dependent methyltransferase